MHQPTWKDRTLEVLELIGFGFFLLLLVEAVGAGLVRITANLDAGPVPVEGLVTIFFWAGRVSVFGYLGARAAGRAGEWWLAVPAAVVAAIAVVLPADALSLLVAGHVAAGPAAASAVAALDPGRLIPQLGRALLIGGLVGPAGILVGLTMRRAGGSSESRAMEVVGGLVTAAAALLLIAGGVADGVRPASTVPLEAAAVPLPEPSAQPAGTDDLRGVLEGLVRAQDAYRARTGAYAERIADLGVDVPAGTTLELVDVGPQGWSGRVANDRRPRSGCAYYTGSVATVITTPGELPVARGRVMCDR